jgi:hypothetical protein
LYQRKVAVENWDFNRFYSVSIRKNDLRMLDSFPIVFWGHVPIGFARKIGSNMVVLSGCDLAETIPSSIQHPFQAHVVLDDGSFQSGLER